MAQSSPVFASCTLLSSEATETASTLFRSNFSTLLSRRSNVDRLKVDSRNAETRKTFFSFGSFA